ncbi:hypothetical protein AwDysgo_14220 [Bacteroidales bacterium]|nr:hypothetical protein AwDysgo_14220 [Bacteroidales bacterium]
MNKKIIYHIISLLVLFCACDSVEDRQDLGNVLTENQLVFDLIQTPAGSNSVVFQNQTANIIPYYDWGTGFSNKPRTEAYFPFAGEYTVNFTAFCAGGTVSTNKKFTVDQNDPNYFENPIWNLLTNTTGKTWVWALDHPSGHPYGNGPVDCLEPGWWQVTVAEIEGWGIAQDEITFDINGAANFSIKTKDGIKTGFFDIGEMTVEGQVFPSLKISGATMSRDEDKSGLYHIVKLTQDELIVHQEYNVSIYKRKGFMY